MLQIVEPAHCPDTELVASGRRAGQPEVARR